MTRTYNVPQRIILLLGAVIAQWIRLRLASYSPGLKSQALHQRFFHLESIVLYLSLHWEKYENGQKRPDLAHIKKIIVDLYELYLFLRLHVIRNFGIRTNGDCGCHLLTFFPVTSFARFSCFKVKKFWGHGGHRQDQPRRISLASFELWDPGRQKEI